jgi:hypothetical protein
VPPAPACYSLTSIEEDGLRAHPPNGVYLVLLGRCQESARCISGLQLPRIPLLRRQAMYACTRETGGEFYAGVCRLGDRPLAFRDPPPPLRHWRIDPCEPQSITA